MSDRELDEWQAASFKSIAEQAGQPTVSEHEDPYSDIDYSRPATDTEPPDPYDDGPDLHVVSNDKAKPHLDVTNQADALHDARTYLGTGPTAGLFRRGNEVAKTVLIGEEGYVQPDDDADDNGPSQLRRLSAPGLAATLDAKYDIQRVSVKGNTTPALFPIEVAKRLEAAPEYATGLRPISGVVNTPILRPDKTVLATPGYDKATRLLYLPDKNLHSINVPTNPTATQVAGAVDAIASIIAEFPFVTTEDRVNYYAAMLAPLIRPALPTGSTLPLHVINAPMIGSGKSLLAKILIIIHGGVLRTKLPTEGAEIRKQITTILDTSTAPIVVWDNITGTLRSGDLAALLTSTTWNDRRLGGNEDINRPNDRLWTVTGNNVQLGGDMARRGLWATIDPDMATPWTRDNFTIKNLESYVRTNRALLLTALLTIITNWVQEGAPTTTTRSDTFAGFTDTTTALIHTSGLATTDLIVMGDATNRADIGADDEEWADFLQALRNVFNGNPFTVADIMHELSKPQAIESIAALTESLPDDLADRHHRSYGPSINKSLGKWLANREGRWAGGLVVRKAFTDRHKKTQVYIVNDGKSANE